MNRIRITVETENGQGGWDIDSQLIYRDDRPKPIGAALRGLAEEYDPQTMTEEEVKVAQALFGNGTIDLSSILKLGQ